MAIRSVLQSCYRFLLRRLSGYGFGQFFFIKPLSDLLRSRLRSVATIQGHVMHLDRHDTLQLFLKGIHDPVETELVKRILKEGDVVIDIGAHIGYYTLLFAKAVGPCGRVFAFEPAPESFSLLRRNVENNKYHNVSLIQAAVCDTNGRMFLFLSGQDPVDHRIYDPGDGRTPVEIEALRLDDYLEDKASTVSFIKMDIQGAEVAAMRGMNNILRENSDIKMLVEFWPRGLTAINVRPEEFLVNLESYGFHLYYVNENACRLQRIDSRASMASWMPKEKSYANLLCAKQPLADSLRDVGGDRAARPAESR